MIRNVHIENYKSIESLTLDLGRITVLIGANGSGKSNILEALALASAASQDKLDNEFLISRGIRVTETRFMRSAFSEESRADGDIKISVSGGGDEGADVSFDCNLRADETSSYPRWVQRAARKFPFVDAIKFLETRGIDSEEPFTVELLREWFLERAGSLPGFLVYSPENSSLRTFQSEGQILPLGIKGEGLFSHLKALSTEAHRDRLTKIKDRLTLIDWFESFEVPEDLGLGERSIRIRDRFLSEGFLFDQRSANEGFLFLLFYFTLFISPDTPAFFSVDNIDASLNPKLCSALLQELIALAKEHGKQAIFTTHNPAVLDGLDLHDDEQRLLVVDRNKHGHTRVRRVEPPKQIEGQPPVNLSEAFMRGYIGGLPKRSCASQGREEAPLQRGR